MGTKKIYRIVVRGELSERYAAAFEGMDMQMKTGLPKREDGWSSA